MTHEQELSIKRFSERLHAIYASDVKHHGANPETLAVTGAMVFLRLMANCQGQQEVRKLHGFVTKHGYI